MTEGEIRVRTDALFDKFGSFQIAGFFNRVEARALVGVIPEGTDVGAVDARVMKALLVWVKGRLDANPAVNREYADQTEWKVMNQLLGAARLKELTRVKIVRKNRNVDCSDLGETFYGRKVLVGLGFGKRRIYTRDEYDRIAAEFARIKLVLPEAIEPTFTERFFAGEL